MARIRSIKPEFFTSLSIADLDLTARLTFIGLWTQCDDEGRCVDDARLIKAALWPLDDRTAADVDGDLQAIHQAALIIRYEVEGRRYLAVRGWHEHQRVNRPSPSKIPPPPDPPTSPHGGLSEGSVRAQTLPEGWPREPSKEGEMSDSDDRRAVRLVSVPTGPDDPATPALNSQNGLTEDSLNPHGGLTEDSLGERKGRERNKDLPPTAGATQRRAVESGSSGSSPPNAGDVVAAWVEGAQAAGGGRPAGRLIAQIGRQAKELIDEGKDPARLIEAATAAGRKGFADLGRELLRMSAGGGQDPGGGSRFAPNSGSRAKLPTADEIANGQVIL
jgi:hypothetical protein